jgi:cysteine sulfinate desulfinase/cysteine desulfurase-like protein
MGVPERFALGTIRLSVGRLTSDQEVDRGLACLIRAIKAAQGERGV